MAQLGQCRLLAADVQVLTVVLSTAGPEHDINFRVFYPDHNTKVACCHDCKCCCMHLTNVACLFLDILSRNKGRIVDAKFFEHIYDVHELLPFGLDLVTLT
jgi:hypothetical protein